MEVVAEQNKAEGVPLSYAERLDKPNFGYGDIKVSKLLVHPIKVCYLSLTALNILDLLARVVAGPLFNHVGTPRKVSR
jgi:hypothetical protein